MLVKLTCPGAACSGAPSGQALGEQKKKEERKRDIYESYAAEFELGDVRENEKISIAFLKGH